MSILGRPGAALLWRRLRPAAVTAALTVVLAGGLSGITTTAASAAPAQPEYPSTWTIAVGGTRATGVTPSGITVTAVTRGAATFASAGPAVLNGPVDTYLPTTTGALVVTTQGCSSDCGGITYSYSRAITAPTLYVSDIGTSDSTAAGITTAFHATPITLPVGSGFVPHDASSGNANAVVIDGGRTLQHSDAAAPVGRPADPASCGADQGCAAVDVTSPTTRLTSLTMSFGHQGTGTSADSFPVVLATTPAPAPSRPAPAAASAPTSTTPTSATPASSTTVLPTTVAPTTVAPATPWRRALHHPVGPIREDPQPRGDSHAPTFLRRGGSRLRQSERCSARPRPPTTSPLTEGSTPSTPTPVPTPSWPPSLRQPTAPISTAWACPTAGPMPGRSDQTSTPVGPP